MKKYTLAKSLTLTAYGSSYYLYDANLEADPVLTVPTQKITHNVFAATQILILNNVKKTPTGFSELQDLIESAQPKGLTDTASALDYLLEQGLLSPVEEPLSHEAQVAAKLAARFSDGRILESERFDETEQYRRLAPHTFFNVPTEIDDADVAVGMVGVPLVTMTRNLGSWCSPDLLRGHTRSMSWLKTHQKGYYSEVVMTDYKPDILGRDIVVKDYGNLDFSGRSVGEALEICRAAVQDLAFDKKITPLFIGGDHVIAFPLVKAFQEQVPDLHLLHLDAHNDLFYAKEVSFRHSAPMTNLIRYTDLAQIFTFGVRTYCDHRVDNMEKFYRNDGSANRVQIHNLMETKRLITGQTALREKLRAYKDKPFYLTIDLDVLSDRDCQVSTALGEGLTWHELLEFVVIAFEECNIIGCDISEYNVLGTTIPYNNSLFLNSLLLLLVDRLGKAHHRRINENA